MNRQNLRLGKNWKLFQATLSELREQNKFRKATVDDPIFVWVFFCGRRGREKQ